MRLIRIVVSTRFDWSPHTSRFTVRMPTSTHDIFTERVVQEIGSQLKSARGDTNIAAVLDLVKSESTSDIYLYGHEAIDERYSKHTPDAFSYGTFLQACHDIARSLKLPACDEPKTDLCELVSKWLNEEDHRWLMILDNADNAELFFPSAESDSPPATVTQTQRPLNDYLPSTLNPQKSLLVTTRSRLAGEDLAWILSLVNRQLHTFMIRASTYVERSISQFETGHCPSLGYSFGRYKISWSSELHILIKSWRAFFLLSL